MTMNTRTKLLLICLGGLATAWTLWLFLSSLHTDTTTPFGVLAFGSLAATVLAVTEDRRWLWLAGMLTGLALLIPLGAYALEQAITDQRLRRGAMVLIVGLLAFNAIEIMRADIRFTNSFVDKMEDVVATVETLPDTNGDGEIVLMTQD